MKAFVWMVVALNLTAVGYAQEQPEAPPEPADGLTTAVKALSEPVEAKTVQALVEATKESRRVAAENEKLEAQVVAQQKETEQAKGQEAEEKTATLLMSGVTVGAAATIQIRFAEIDKVKQVTTPLTAMPYVMVLPGYWGGEEAAKRACASHWSGADKRTVHKAAVSAARSDAEQIYEDVVNHLTSRQISRALKADETDVKDIVRLLSLGTTFEEAGGADFVVQIQGVRTATDAQAAQRLKQAVIDSMASTLWKPVLSPRCTGKKFGFWLGFPVGYDATFERNGARHQGSVKATIASGLAFNANKYFALLLGFTVGNATVEVEGDQPTEIKSRTFSPTVAFGGNVDMLIALVKALGG